MLCSLYMAYLTDVLPKPRMVCVPTAKLHCVQWVHVMYTIFIFNVPTLPQQVPFRQLIPMACQSDCGCINVTISMWLCVCIGMFYACVCVLCWGTSDYCLGTCQRFYGYPQKKNGQMEDRATATRERLINETWLKGRGERKGKSRKGSSRLEVNAQRVSVSVGL